MEQANRLGAPRRTIGVVARPKDQHVVLRALDACVPRCDWYWPGWIPTALAESPSATAPHAVVCLPFTPDVRPLYELLELVLLPSRSEGLSQALLEAMALGKPVIASAATGNLDLITDGVDGRLVRHWPQAWAAAIDELLAEPELASRLAAAGRHTARVTFSLEHTVERTARLYEAVLTSFPQPEPAFSERLRGKGLGLHYRPQRHQARLPGRGEHPVHPADLR